MLLRSVAIPVSEMVSAVMLSALTAHWPSAAPSAVPKTAEERTRYLRYLR